MLRGRNSPHRRHLRDAQAWEKETQRKDWYLISVTVSGGVWRYRWAGPGEFVRTCHGTEASASFLASVREGLSSFRMAFAERVSDDAVAARVAFWEERDRLMEAQQRTV